MLVQHVVQAWRDNGLPPNLPFFMTEGNMGGSGPRDVKSARSLADYVGAMMSEGASGTFHFHYMPTPGGPGGFLALDKDYRVLNYPPQYLAAQVITKESVQPVDAPHRMFRATSDVTDESGNVLVTAYALERPDGLGSMGASANGMPGRNPDGPTADNHPENRRPPRDPHTFSRPLD